MVIRANWMTLGFANAKRNVQAPARDPSEKSAPAALNFAEPFSCEAPSGSPGFGEVQWPPSCGTTGQWPGNLTWVCSLPGKNPTAPSSAGLGPGTRLWSPPPHPRDPIPTPTATLAEATLRQGGAFCPLPVPRLGSQPSPPLLTRSIGEGRAFWVPSLTPSPPLFFSSLLVPGPHQAKQRLWTPAFPKLWSLVGVTQPAPSWADATLPVSWEEHNQSL